MTLYTILDSWEKTGLVLYNSSMVFSKAAHLQETHKTSSLTEDSDDEVLKHTPHNLKTVIEFDRQLKV